MRHARSLGLAILYRDERIRSIIRGYMCLPLLFHGHIAENCSQINNNILDDDHGLYIKIYIIYTI